ncbi:MAG: hypothetical protein IJ274_09645 [Lachnospiraceae bacterium]|nr:hypothetical protein [Lachnospiraceae bacterium]
MKNKGNIFIICFILCLLFGCGKNDGQTVESSETINIIEGTYIVRAEDREKEVLENTADEENTETVTDTEEVTAENTENVEDKNEKPQTAVSDKTDSGNEKPATQEKPSQQGQTTTPSKPTTTTQPTTPSKPSTPSQPATPSEPTHTHSYSSSVTTKATCTKNGVETFRCSCGDSYEETISATGHNYVCDSEEVATCQSEGCRYYICNECWEASYTETVPKTAHNYVGTVTVEPGCTTTGVKSYTCSCGASYTEAIPATGHDFCGDNQADNIIAPTCTQNGSATYWCWNWQCEYRETRVLPATGHRMVETLKIITKATCTTNGLRITKECWNTGCEECVTEVIPATGHTNINGRCLYCGIDMEE